MKAEIAKAKAAGIATFEDIDDLHRPYVDDVVLISDSGKPMKRELDLIDVWFDSGSMPYAQWHYPFENKETFEAAYPADFIAEGVDQTRGWFFTLHVISTLLNEIDPEIKAVSDTKGTSNISFKNVMANGLVLDAEGNKMSKTKGNVVDPFTTLRKYGSDAVRWYMITNANPWDNLKFDLAGVEECSRKFFGTLKNTYSFFALYANLDNFSFEQAPVPLSERTEADRWVLSKLNSLIKEVDTAYAEYEPTKAGRLIQDYVMDNLSNWYVRLNRKRFWKGTDADKVAAYQTLYTCLETISRLMSPIAPFYADQLFLDLNATTGMDTAESVHLANFPTADDAAINLKLEAQMELAQTASSLVHSIRKTNGSKLKVRQPLSKVLIPVHNAEMKKQVEAMAELIKSEVNVKEVEALEDTSFIKKRVKPNFPKLGKVYGKQMKAVAAIIQTFTQDQINELEAKGELKSELEGNAITFVPDDVMISFEDVEGWAVAASASVTVALDINITEELRKEGIAREFVNRIQNIRKDQGFDVQDKIKISVQDVDTLVSDALQANSEYICAETQALELTLSASVANSQEVEIDEWKMGVNVAL